MTRLAISFALASLTLTALADISPRSEVQKRIGVADSAIVHKNLKLLLTTITKDFKGIDHRGNVVANADSFEHLRRMFDQSRNIISTIKILKFKCDGLTATLVTDNYLSLFVKASGNLFESRGQNEDKWVRENGVFKMMSSRTLMKREFLNGKPMHGGIIK
jgi:hypothetical protein